MLEPVAAELSSKSGLSEEYDTEAGLSDDGTPVKHLPDFLRAVDTVCLRAEAVSEREMKVSQSSDLSLMLELWAMLQAIVYIVASTGKQILCRQSSALKALERPSPWLFCLPK